MTKFTLFWPNMGMTTWVFHENLKNDMRALCLWENRRFFDQIWAWEQFVFLDNGLFSHMAWEKLFFSWKSRKKGLPIYFFGQYSVGLTELKFFWTKYGRAGGFSYKFEKKITWKHIIFREWTYFWQNMDMR